MPLLLPFIAVFGCGLIVTTLQSFGFLMFSYSYEDVFFAYRELFSDSWFVSSALFSLYVSLAASMISVCIGVFLSYQLWQLPVKYHNWLVIYKIPLILPHIAIGFLAVILLAKTGVISSVMYRFGVINDFSQFPSLLYSSTGLDLILAYVYKETPFVMVLVYGVLCRFDQRRIETAKMFGASGIRIFFSLVLPFLMPVINTAIIILFVFTFGGFDLPFVVGDSYPGMLSLRVYEYFFQKDIALRPIAMAILTIMFVFSLVFIGLYLRVSQRLEMGARKL